MAGVLCRAQHDDTDALRLQGAGSRCPKGASMPPHDPVRPPLRLQNNLALPAGKGEALKTGQTRLS